MNNRMNCRMKNRWIVRIGMLIALAVLAIGSAPAAEAAKTAAVKSVEYEGKGKVEVEFKQDVSWKKAKVTVKDAGGKIVRAVILKKDEDDISFRLKSYKAGKKYSFTIAGVRRRGSSTSQKVTGTFRIPAGNKITAEKVEYDPADREVEIEFRGRVGWRSPKVTVTAPDGTDLVRRIMEKDDDSIEVKVKELTPGIKYQYRITGITKKGSAKKLTVKGSFTA